MAIERSHVNGTTLKLNRLLMNLQVSDFENREDRQALLELVADNEKALGIRPGQVCDKEPLVFVLDYLIREGRVDVIPYLVQLTVEIDVWYHNIGGGLYYNDFRIPLHDVFLAETIIFSEAKQTNIYNCFHSLREFFPRSVVLNYSLLSASCCVGNHELFNFFLEIVGNEALFYNNCRKDLLHANWLDGAGDDADGEDDEDPGGFVDDGAGDDADGENEYYDEEYSEPLIVFLCGLGEEYSKLVLAALVTNLSTSTGEEFAKTLGRIDGCITSNEWKICTKKFLITELPHFIIRK